ncbi:Oligopeptide transport system permease protein AppC [Hyphomicrobiales bacterium]|nr:Oligopeptide transport system permease protein AppC [Hyphomicrobiales bacterium]CAH1695729.1 Oligopeptide transport system permease protein AppC [Hyphomicrobiales bacterium]
MGASLEQETELLRGHEPRNAGGSVDPGGESSAQRNRALRSILVNPTAMFGLVVLGLIVLIAILAPWIYPNDPLDMVARPFLWPGQDPRFPLGTDALGRDVAAALVHGSRVSLLVGFAATLVSVFLGLVVGAASGYYGGRVDAMLGRLVELFQTMPSFVLILVLVAITEPSIAVIALAIGLVSWTTVARLVRTEFRALREREFVSAARSLGYGDFRIVVRQILPNALPPVIVTSSIMVASAILSESSLSFLGLGDPNYMSWGAMIGAGREMLRTEWFLVAIPGAAIAITVLSLNLVGDGLNDALNPRARRRR